MSAKTGSFAGLVVSDKHIDCNSCAHFFITWNKRFPFGCRAMGFMSANSPNKDVFEVEGRDCLAYKDKRLTSKEKQSSRMKTNGGKDRDIEENVKV